MMNFDSCSLLAVPQRFRDGKENLLMRKYLLALTLFFAVPAMPRLPGLSLKSTILFLYLQPATANTPGKLLAASESNRKGQARRVRRSHLRCLLLSPATEE